MNFKMGLAEKHSHFLHERNLPLFNGHLAICFNDFNYVYDNKLNNQGMKNILANNK